MRVVPLRSSLEEGAWLRIKIGSADARVGWHSIATVASVSTRQFLGRSQKVRGRELFVIPLVRRAARDPQESFCPRGGTGVDSVTRLCRARRQSRSDAGAPRRPPEGQSDR